MLRNAAFKAALIAVEVVVSGYTFVMTVPLIVGGIVVATDCIRAK